MYIILLMKILTRYIFKQIFIGFLVVAVSLLAMLWLTQSLRFVEIVTRKGLPVYLFAEMTSYLMPRIFNILSPIAAFVAVLFTYNRLTADRELVVMQSVGISPAKNALPAIYFGILLTIFNIYVMNFGIPSAERTFKELEWKIKNNLTQMAFREGEFTQIKGGVTIFIDKHEADDSISGIFVSDETKPDIKVTLTAEKGRIIKSENGSRILFINGVRQELNKKTYQFNSLAFSRYSADFNIEQNHGKRNQTARELSLKELLNSRNNPDFDERQQRKNIVEGHRRLIYPFYNLISALLACVGLLISSFNRRGQAKIIAIEVLCMILVMGGDLAVTNLAGRSLYFISLLYLNCFVPLCACLYLLLFYNPSFFRHKSVKEQFNAA